MMEMNSTQIKKAKTIATIAGALICGVMILIRSITHIRYSPYWSFWSEHYSEFLPSFIASSIVLTAVYAILGGVTAYLVVLLSIKRNHSIHVSKFVVRAITIDVVWSLIAIITCYILNAYLSAAVGILVALIAFFAFEPLIQGINNNIKGEANMNEKVGAAASMGIIAKISWAAIAIGGAVAGGFIGDEIVGGRGIIAGALIGFAAGALAGFLVNLFLLYLAELGQNTAKTAANSGGHSSASTADEIQKYKEMLDNGTITQQEFEDLKRNLIQK